MTSAPVSVAIALGSNLGDRSLNLRRAVDQLRSVVDIVAVSGIHETEPIDAPVGSRRFLNMVIVGHTRLGPEELMKALLAIEERLGRVRRGRNAPRTIDLDLILHSANLRHSKTLTLPHPRYLHREFVMAPLRELRLPWVDPITGRDLR